MGITIDTFTDPLLQLEDQPIIGYLFTFIFTILPFLSNILLSVSSLLLAIPLAFYRVYMRYKLNRTPLDWSKQTVFITGTAQPGGIGHTLVHLLASEKKPKCIIAVDIKPHTFAHLSNAANIHTYACDVSNKDASRQLCQAIIAAHGSPTIIINNAGVLSGKLITDLTDSDIERTIGVNLLAHFWTIRQFLPQMLQANDGYIVSVASFLGHLTSQRLTDYSASKFGAIGLHEALHAELSSTNIKTICICPGFIRTSMFHGFEYRIPFFVRALTVDEVAGAIVRSIDRQRTDMVLLPFFTKLAPITKTLPWEVLDVLRGLSGSDEGMKGVRKAQ